MDRFFIIVLGGKNIPNFTKLYRDTAAITIAYGETIVY